MGKVYNGITDESARFEIFKGHVDFIYSTNARNLSFSLKVTEFADLTTSEFVNSCPKTVHWVLAPKCVEWPEALGNS